MFNCNVCNKSFARRSYLTVHQRIHSNIRPYRCHICGCAFYRGDHLVRHRAKQHGEVKVPTTRVNNISLVSNNTTTTTLTPTTDNIINHPQGTLYTQQQPTSLQQVQTEQGQIQVVTVQTTSEVEEAEVQQAFKCTNNNCTDLNNHNYGESLVAVVSDDKTTFHACEIVHQNQGVPDIPVSTQTIDENGTLQRQVCQGSITTIANSNATFVTGVPTLNTVTTTTTPVAATPAVTPMTATTAQGTLAYRCEYCSKCFSRRDNLERHKLTHLNEKLFSCDVCQKSFSRRSYLSVHRRIHTGEKPFVCDRCGFAFSRKDHLLKHKKANEGQRKLSCVPPKHSVILKEDVTGTGETCHQVAVVVTTDANVVTEGAVVVAHGPPATDEDNVDGELKTVTMYQANPGIATTDGDGTGATTQMYPVMPVFPTIEISPSTTQIFPTIQMYPATTQLNVPLHANVSHEIIIPATQIAQNKWLVDSAALSSIITSVAPTEWIMPKDDGSTFDNKNLK